MLAMTLQTDKLKRMVNSGTFYDRPTVVAAGGNWWLLFLHLSLKILCQKFSS